MRQKCGFFTGRTEGIPHAPLACIEYESTCGGIKAFPKIACKSASSKLDEHLVWLGGLHYSYYTEPYKSDPNLMGFTNEAIGPMISVFMRMMFQVWTSTQSWFSWPKSKVGWSTSGYFWLTLADERTSLEKYNFCCGLFQIQPWQQKQMWQPRENFSKAFPRLLNAVCYVLTLATCGFNGMYVFRKWDAKQ